MKPRFAVSRFLALALLSGWALLLSACGSSPMEAAATVTPQTAPSGGFTPSPPPTSEAILTPTASVPSQPTPRPPQPAILETRRLTLEFPTKIRAGMKSQIVRLTLEVDDLGNITPTAKYQGNVVTGETIQIPDLYDTHYVTAEARLDLAGMTVQPSGSIYEPLKRGQSATFQWSVSPQETGTYRGTVWLHLNFKNRSSGEEDRIAVSAQIIEIEAVDFFGFSVDFVRASGVVGSVLSAILGFPFLDDILKSLFVRKRGKKRKK